jgi:peptidoglycan/LPS O-acetylase OafA/YrhL
VADGLRLSAFRHFIDADNNRTDFMATVAKPGERILVLDGIRGLAIAMVLVWHYFTVPLSESASPVLRFLSNITLQSWSGVDLFFVLSGFLIGGILIDAKSSQHYFRTFYIRRAFRILPIYVVACLAYFPVSRWAVSGFQGTMKPAMPWYIYATFTQNLWLASGRWHVWLSPTWSLAIEEQFYLTLPLLIWLVPAKHLWKVATTGVIAVLEFRSIAYLQFYPHWSEVAFYVLSPFRADGLLLGVLAAILMRNPARLSFVRERRKALVLVGAFLAAALAWCTWKGWGVMSAAMSTVGYTMLGAFYLVLLLLTIASSGTLQRIFSYRALRWLGTIAYGLYLIHVPALDLSFRLFEHRGPRLAHAFDLVPLTMALGGSLLLAHLSWTLFESRLVRYGHRFVYVKREPSGSA